jgi:uncharacterized LabA/DUF88 family protein
LTSERLKIAVFVDFDNIEIGVKTTLGQHFDIGIILEGIKERGEVVTKIAYGDWTRAGDYSRLLTQHAIRLVQRNLTPGGDKNGADINLALDALEMVFTHEHINAFVIVGGDSDFITLVEKLKQYDKQVFVIGGRAFTSVIMQRNCHEFIAYENLLGPQHASRRAPARGGSRPAATQVGIAQAFPLVRRALKILADREVSPQLGLLKSTLLQLDSTFSERNYSATSFRDFADKLAEGGLVHLKQAGRSVLVELQEGQSFDEGESTGGESGAPAEEGQAPAAVPTPPAEAPAPVAAAPSSGQMDAVRTVQTIFQSRTAPLRWPMYIRNVKQVIKAADPSFDERRYGFGGILDFLRSCQREGLFRLERDRNGGLRVYPAAGLQLPVNGGGTAHVEESPGQDAAAGGESHEAAMHADEASTDAGLTGEESSPGFAGPDLDEQSGDVDGNRLDLEGGQEDAAESAAKKPRRARKSAAGARKKPAGAARRPAARKPRAKREAPPG